MEKWAHNGRKIYSKFLKNLWTEFDRLGTEPCDGKLWEK